MNTEDIREAISANLVFKEHQIGVAGIESLIKIDNTNAPKCIWEMGRLLGLGGSPSLGTQAAQGGFK